ncbi:MAG TPA: hypothetical protein VJL58_08390, partial [Pyrinomonadaceae bacterium]|nr:hypothetical protein [Pyrinomonadaceae bacterium]
MKKFTAFILAFAIAAGASSILGQTRTRSNGSGAATASRFGNVDAISARQLREHLEFIASDELEGRDTPSRGLDIAALYIAKHLMNWGIKPGGDSGSYFQKFPLKRSKIDVQNMRLELNGQSFVYGEDYFSSLIQSNVPASNLVYVSHGWVIKSKNINAYQGIDVKDKIIVVVNSFPKGVTPNDLQGKAGEDWFSPPLYAQANGAKAVIAFGTFNDLANWQATRWRQTERGAVNFGDTQNQIRVPTITASP